MIGVQNGKSPWPLYIGLALVLGAISLFLGSSGFAMIIVLIVITGAALLKSGKKDLILGKIKKPDIGTIGIPWKVMILCLVLAWVIGSILGFYLWEAVVTAGVLFIIWLVWKGLGRFLISPFYRGLKAKGQTWIIWLCGLIVIVFAGVVCGTMLLEFLYEIFNAIAYS